MKTLLLFLALVCSALCQEFHLRDGDRVLFYGDSITDQRLYTTFTETYVLTRFPRRDISFIHKGWGGDRVTGGSGGTIGTRLERDVFPYNPTVMTVMLGMNDGRYRAFDQAIFDAYAAGYRDIVKQVRAALPDTRLTLIQPSPYDDVTRPELFPGGYNAVLRRYGTFVKELASVNRLHSADLNTPVIAELQKAMELDAAAAPGLIQDRVHPGAGGQLLMAKALLKSWNAPSVVTDVHIDLTERRVRSARNAKVSGIEGLGWQQTDDALPMPLNLEDAMIALAVRSSDVMASLNRQPLRISGLAAEKRYELRIDGEGVGTFSGAEFARGVDLAGLATPMTKQAAEVHELTLKRTAIHQARWRNIDVPNETGKFSSAPAAMAALDELEREMLRAQRAAAQPRSRRYELIEAR